MLRCRGAMHEKDNCRGCVKERLLNRSDPDAPDEAEFEYHVAAVLDCVYKQQYRCVTFSGSFTYEGETYRPDLALVAFDFSHWFIIEVELLAHSFERHVMPQVRAFRYGEPKQDGIRQLSEQLEISSSSAETLILHVPRSVAVVVNKWDAVWETSLRSHGIQLLAVTTFRSDIGVNALDPKATWKSIKRALGSAPTCR